MALEFCRRRSFPRSLGFWGNSSRKTVVLGAEGDSRTSKALSLRASRVQVRRLTMKVAMISCWFRHQIYSDYAEELRAALNERLDEEVTVVSGDCRCAVRDGDRYTNAVDQNARFLTMTYQPNPSSKIKMPGKLRADWKIGRAYLELAADADVIHFQEVTNAFGTVPALSFLAAPSDKVRVVTVHELERFRNRFKTLYRLYNRADAILVHGRDLKETLVDLGVDERRIHVVPWGARVASFVAERREGILYYGG
ncbi:MAG TPA: hypothetical protein ENK07_09310, partial [Bacteroidetes bacterium]|nr:hypothetical protein [Bacteroidota bacterium]